VSNEIIEDHSRDHRALILQQSLNLSGQVTSSLPSG
jgi:hypothetical protein